MSLMQTTYLSSQQPRAASSRRILSALILLLLLPGLHLAHAQSLIAAGVDTDLDCKFQLDNGQIWRLRGSGPWMPLGGISVGKHVLQATSIDGLSKTRIEVNVTPGEQVANFNIRLKADHDSKLAAAAAAADAADLAQHPTWTDNATGLTWVRKDNGGNVTLSQAASYCKSLTVDAHSDWHLPAYSQLRSIFDQSRAVEPRPDTRALVKGGIHLGEYQVWSNSTSPMYHDDPTIRISLNFYSGNPLFARIDNTEGGRALCMRNSR